MKENHFRFVLVVLLAAILTCQLVIVLRLPTRPVHAGDIYGEAAKKNTAEQQQSIIDQLPLVRVVGEVGVSGGVSIDNTPLEVTIVR